MGRMIETLACGTRRAATTGLGFGTALLLTLAGCGSVGPAPKPADGGVASPPISSTAPAAGPSTAPSAPPAGPTFTDVTKGNTSSVVKLLALDLAARSAVVEPTAMMTGDEYCAMFSVPEADDRCRRASITEDSKTKATLPVQAGVKLSTVRGGDPACIDRRTGAGTCTATSRQFVQWLKDNPQGLVRLTTVSGKVTALAEVYLP
jgi:hypothetical protein